MNDEKRSDLIANNLPEGWELLWQAGYAILRGTLFDWLEENPCNFEYKIVQTEDIGLRTKSNPNIIFGDYCIIYKRPVVKEKMTYQEAKEELERSTYLAPDGTTELRDNSFTKKLKDAICTSFISFDRLIGRNETVVYIFGVYIRAIWYEYSNGFYSIEILNKEN